MKGRLPGRTDRPELNPGRGVITMDNGQWTMDNGQWMMFNVQSSMFNGQWMTCLLCQLVMFWNTVAGFGTPFALPKENRSEKYKPQINNYHAER